MNLPHKKLSQDLSCVTEDSNSTIELMVDTVSYPEKPPKVVPKGVVSEYAKIPNRLGKSPVTLTIPQLIDATLNGQSFTPALFQNERCTRANWLSQQVFALDFDSGWTLDAYWDIVAKYNIPPCFVYPSYNYKPDDQRFRAVHLCDQPITDLRLRNLIQNTLFDMFTIKTENGKLSPDPKCTPPHHYFLGTDKPLIHADPDNCFNPADLVDGYLQVKKTEDSAHFQRFRTGFAADNHVNLCNLVNQGFFIFNSYTDEQPNGETLAASYLLYKGHATISPNSVGFGSEPDSQSDFQTQVIHGDAILQILWTIDVDTSLHSPQNSRDKKPETQNKKNYPSSHDSKVLQTYRSIRIVDVKEQLLERCRLLREFKDGTRLLNHSERLLIGSNLLNTNGGPKFYNECFTSRIDYQRPDQMFIDISNRKYHPQGCARHCPFDNECVHRKNLLQQIPVKRNEYRRIYDSPNRKTLDDTQILIRNALETALNEPYPGVTVIKSDTGSGKTEQLKHVDISKACLAFVTHKLKWETWWRIVKATGRKSFLWDRPPVLPDKLQTELDRIQQLGIKGKIQLFKDALDTDEVMESMEWQHDIVTHLDASERAHMEPHQFTTHEKAMHYRHVNTVIFDEDPISTFVRIVSVEIADIKLMIKAAKEQNTEKSRYIAAHLMKILRSGADVAHEIPGCYCPGETLYGLIKTMPDTFMSNIGVLFTGDAYVRGKTDLDGSEKVYVVQKRLPPPDIKIIIMSATANEFIYRRLFGNRLNFIDISGTETKGKCVLHPGRGYSKRSIRELGEDAFIKQVMEDREKYGFEAVITHKFIAGKLNEYVPVLGHFGGLAGIDEWKGKKIAVYGTPHPPECLYRLYAHVLSIPCRNGDIDFDWREVIRGEFEFQMQLCSEIPVLQELQLWMIESELAQAVGRARLIHHDNLVHLFSSVPVPGCVIDDELDGG